MENFEREAVVKEFAKIRNAIEASSINYFIEDSPYSAKIHLRKTFRNDWSIRSSPHASTPQLSSRHFTSLPPPHHQSFFNESGYQTQKVKPTTFHDASVQKNDEDYDAVKQELHEARQTIVKLKEEAKSKDSLISNLKKVNSEKDLFKKERDIKSEQLKQKNKLLDESKEKLVKVKEEYETMKYNFEHKFKNLVKKNENTNGKLQTAISEHKQERKQNRIEVKKMSKDYEKQLKDLETLRNEIKSLKKESTAASPTQRKNQGVHKKLL